MQIRHPDGRIIEIDLRDRSTVSAPSRTEQTSWQVGELTRLDVADPELSSKEAAIEMARTESERNEDRVYGVWTGQDHGSELVAIAYQGEVFRN